MKKFISLYVCMFLIIPVFAQTNFQNLSLEKALEKASDENKLVFVDCYTSWCGPCKIMAKEVLPLKEVGDFLNERFVCVKYDMEQGKGPEIAKKYNVEAYPTFLLLNVDGSLVNTIVGMTSTGNEFVYKVKLALGDISTVKMDSLYAAGNRMTRFVLSYLKALEATKQYEKAKAVTTDLMKSLGDGQKSYITYWFLYENPEISPVGSENINYLLSHVDNFRKSVGVEPVNAKLAAMFETQLEDMIRGRNKETDVAEVEVIEKNMKACNLPDKDYLYDYVALLKGMFLADTDMAFAAIMKIYPMMKEEKLSYLYFRPITFLKEKWNEQQKKDLVALSLSLSPKVEKVVLQDGLKYFAREIEKY
ncbi:MULTISPECIES: thioredoxin family protein [Butyricimonas]|uniref:thioredoxin family protein n=1 Tax=Butyricimonas TaxID=574697 RepID=UPI001E4CAD34|nr:MULTISPECIES: thioredoxin family protein [Butyricimonas]